MEIMKTPHNILTPLERKKAAKKRHFTRRWRALFALMLALVAGTYLISCHVFQPSKKKTRTDRKEHRKGMPVRDNVVE
jgi:hypothetical protein